MGQSNLDSFLAAAAHLEICGVEHLKSEDRDDQGAGPQDLSINTNKRRRVNDSYSADSCLPRPAHHMKTETPLNIFMRSNFQTSYNMNQFFSDQFCSKLEVQEPKQSLKIPTGIFSANMEKPNDNPSNMNRR